jgi:hypothetical protein
MSKIDEAKKIIVALGLPKKLHNERSALALLALLNLQENSSWKDIERPMLGIHQIKNWINDHYEVPYAENTRETLRDDTVAYFLNAGVLERNPDNPKRSKTSGKTCYQVQQEAYDLLAAYGSSAWDKKLGAYLAIRETLIERYAKAREQHLVPIVFPDGRTLQFTPGKHSVLIKQIIEDFAPRFAASAVPCYVGDTGNKSAFIEEDLMNRFGASIKDGAQIPDVVLFDEEKNWLYLIESVTSNGPVDGKRYDELTNIFSAANAGLIFVTAFPDRATMRKFLADLAWETEIWLADAPSHLIHFNGHKFLGPYGK